MDGPIPAPGRRELTAYPIRGTRRAQPSAEDAAARTRAAAQLHLDARGARLLAYAAVLEAAVAAGPSDDRRAQLERQLSGVRCDLRAAGRARLPALPDGPLPGAVASAAELPASADGAAKIGGAPC